MLAMAVTVAIVLLFLTKPLQYMPNATLAAVVFVIGVKLIDNVHMAEIWRLRRNEFWIAAVTAAAVVGIGVEQGVILAIVLSVILHVKRHYEPNDAVVQRDEQGHDHAPKPRPGTRFRARPDRLPVRGRPLLRERIRFSEEVLGLVDLPEPPRWLVLLADAMDDVDFTGGETIVETAEQLEQRGMVFAVAEAGEGCPPRARSLRPHGEDRRGPVLRRHRGRDRRIPRLVTSPPAP